MARRMCDHPDDGRHEHSEEVTDHESTHNKEDTVKVFGDLLETELQCTICSELYIKSTTLNCSHTFCEYCINKWAKKRNRCPMCRAVITSKCRGLSFDSFIDKMVQNLSEEMKMKRRQVLKERQDNEAENTVQISDSDTDDEISVSSIPLPVQSYEDFLPLRRVMLSSVETMPGLPDPGYGGYGRCRRCKQFGHWVRGCPFY